MFGLTEDFVIVAINKAATKLAFICKHFSTLHLRSFVETSCTVNIPVFWVFEEILDSISWLMSWRIKLDHSLREKGDHTTSPTFYHFYH